jgi:predicted transcriptional regulator
MATIKKEITKLMAAGFIREILYLDWLANLVLVQKRTWPSGAYVSTIQISTNIA